MRVNIGSIRREQGAALPLHIEIKDPGSIISQLKFVSGEPLRLDGMVTNTGSGYLVEARVRAQLSLHCGRCLKDYSWSLDTALCERFCPVPEGQPLPEPEEDEDFGDDEVDEIHHFHGERIDLTDSVSEHILVSLPMKRLCSDDCAGLCSTCGADLAEGPCSCAEETVDIRMAPLAEWLAVNKEGQDDDNKS